MMQMLLYLFCSLGLGTLLQRLFKDHQEQTLGMFFFMGLCSIYMVMAILNIFGIDLQTASLFTIGISNIGLILFIKNLIRYKKYQIFQHPTFWLFIFFWIIFLLFGKSYYPTSWDEFSHWLTMPKQIFLTKSLYSEDFLTKGFASYTPGWPLLLILKDLPFGDHFEVGNILFLPILFGIFAFGSLYDLTNHHFQDRKKSLGLLFFLILCQVPVRIPSKNVLVEAPMIFTYMVVLISTYQFLTRRTNSDALKLGLLLLFSYYIKHTFMTLAGTVFLLSFFYLIYKKELFKNLAIKMILITAPYLFGYFLWNYFIELNQISNAFRPTYLNVFDTVFVRLQLIPLAFKNLAILVLLPANLIFIGPYLYILFKKKIFKEISWPIGLYFVLYFFALLWMYLSVFGIYESSYLASFDRYMSIPLSAIKLFSAIFIFSYLYDKTSSKKSISFLNKGLFIIAALAFVGFMINLLRIKISNNYITQNSNEVKNIINDHNLIKPSLLIINQGGNDFELHVARYEAIGERKWHYKIPHEHTTWGPVRDNDWRTKVTEVEMKEIFMNNEIIWVMESDEWMDNQLARITSCQSSFANTVLVKNKNNRFQCNILSSKQ